MKYTGAQAAKGKASASGSCTVIGPVVKATIKSGKDLGKKTWENKADKG